MSEWSNRRMRVLFARNPPDAFDDCTHFPTLEPKVDCPFPGWCVEILHHLLQYMHYELEPVILDASVGEVNWGCWEEENNTFSGILHLIENGTIDTTCLLYQSTRHRRARFSLSYPVTNVKPTYVVHSHQPNFASRMWSAFNPYSNATWLAMLAMLAVQIAYCLAIARMGSFGKKAAAGHHPLTVVWNFIRLQLYQPDHGFHYGTWAGRVSVAIFALLQCRLLMDTYQTMLLSALLAPTSRDPFATANDVIRLVSTKEYQLVTNYVGNWYIESIYTSNSSHYSSLRRAIADNPIRVVGSGKANSEKNVMAALKLVESGPYIYPIQEDSLAMQIAKRHCDFVFVREGLPEVASHFVFRRGSPHLRAFNHAILMNGDFIRRTFQKYFTSGYKTYNDKDGTACEEQELEELDDVAVRKVKGKHRNNVAMVFMPLDLYSMFGVMLLMLLGIALSIVALLAEIYFAWQAKTMLTLRNRTRRAMADSIRRMHCLERGVVEKASTHKQ